jgi:biopolymer transport protein ExbD/biopolymer transport protein TolR
MITAPMMTQAIKVKTPKVKAENIEIEETIKITIDKDKNIYLGDKKVSRDELYRYLKDKLSLRELPILLIADERLEYGFVLSIIGDIREIGYKQIGFVTSGKNKEEKDK